MTVEMRTMTFVQVTRESLLDLPIASSPTEPCVVGSLEAYRGVKN